MKTEIVKIKGDWQEVVDDCRSTVSKPPLGKEPSVDFKKKILLAEHSPIRDIYIKWKWKLMPHWVTVHWVRHKWECFVSTQRTDRTGVDRNNLPQDEPQNFTGDANVQHLIDTMRKRLCYQASKETREYAEDLKKPFTRWSLKLRMCLSPTACIGVVAPKLRRADSGAISRRQQTGAFVQTNCREGTTCTMPCFTTKEVRNELATVGDRGLRAACY